MKIASLFGISFIFTILILSTSLPYQTIEAQKGGPDFIPGQYIVVLEDGVSSQNVIKKHGAAPDFVYSHALNGFSAPLSPAALAELKQDPRVKYVEQVQKLSISVQDIPTGIDRIDAEPGTSTTSYADKVTVAIIDTGIADHLDLNVVKKVNCAKKGPFNQECKEGNANDANGHGTHVAGTVAARDNTEGVVGVAPGADLWAMKVFKDNGDGWTSYSIAALDYIIGQGGVDVVNMSLTSSTSQAVNDAVKRTYDAGIVVVVAAGNQLSDASTRSPASAPEAITVSAIADFDGKGGGKADQTVNFSICTEDTDDSFACFSNFGSLIDIAAPGVLILSTWNDGGYATISGTSMASPHVAGAAAKLIADARNSIPSMELTPQQVLNKLVTEDSIKAGETNYFTGDVDAFAEPLLYVGDQTQTTEPTFSISSDPEITIKSGSSDSTTVTVSSVNGFSDDVTLSTTTPTDITATLDPTSVSILIDGSQQSSLTIKVDSSIASGQYDVEISGTNGIITQSTILTVNVQTIPSAPQDLQAAPGDSQVTLTWIAPNSVGGSEITNYNVYRVSSSQETPIATTLGDDLTFTDSELNNDQEYRYKVTSENNVGESDFSIEVSATPSASSTPTFVTVDSVTVTGQGGKNADKHVVVTVVLIDNLGNPISGASVTTELYRDGVFLDDATGTTSDSGTAVFSLKNARSGTYVAHVTNVVAELQWSDKSPVISDPYIKK